MVVSSIIYPKSQGISAYWRACALYACIVITCSRGGSIKYSCHSCSWSTDQGKLLIAYLCSRLRIWSRETGSDVPSRASQLYTYTEPESVVRVPTGFLPFSPCRAHSFIITPLAIGPIRSLSGHATDICTVDVLNIVPPTTHCKGLLLRVGSLPCAPTTYSHGIAQHMVFDRFELAQQNECSWQAAGRRYFQHAHFVPIVIVGKRGPY